MPIYEYRCDSCDHELEALQKMADAPLTDCPACEAPSLKKLISAVGFRLAGSGWYETDFKTGDKKKNLAGDAKSDKDTKSDKKESSSGSEKPKPDKKADSKPTKKAEPKAKTGSRATSA